MKRISFGLTQAQFLDGTKDVTRRLGWHKLKAGERLLAVNKVMGFRKGEQAIEFGVVVVVSVRREPLSSITQEDVRREGFPTWTPEDFVNFYCKAQRKVTPDTEVTRIEFRRTPAIGGLQR